MPLSVVPGHTNRLDQRVQWNSCNRPATMKTMIQTSLPYHLVKTGKGD